MLDNKANLEIVIPENNVRERKPSKSPTKMVHHSEFLLNLNNNGEKRNSYIRPRLSKYANSIIRILIIYI
jgi:hypothetical protein